MNPTYGDFAAPEGLPRLHECWSTEPTPRGNTRGGPHLIRDHWRWRPLLKQRRGAERDFMQRRSADGDQDIRTHQRAVDRDSTHWPSPSFLRAKAGVNPMNGGNRPAARAAGRLAGLVSRAGSGIDPRRTHNGPQVLRVSRETRIIALHRAQHPRSLASLHPQSRKDPPWMAMSRTSLLARSTPRARRRTLRFERRSILAPPVCRLPMMCPLPIVRSARERTARMVASSRHRGSNAAA